MYLLIGSGQMKGVKETPMITAPFPGKLLPGSIQRQVNADHLLFVSQQCKHPEADLYLHHILCRPGVHLYAVPPPGSLWLVCCQNGRCTIRRGDREKVLGRDYDTLLFRCYGEREVHFYVDSGDCQLLLFMFHSEGEKMMADYYVSLTEKMSAQGELFLQASYMERYCQSMLSHPAPGPASLFPALIAEQIRTLLRLASESLHSEATAAGREKSWLVRRLIDRDPGQHWTLKILAQKAGWNLQSLTHGFKDVHGLSVHQYVMKARMQMAWHLLQSTKLPVRSIACKCGFKRPHHFARAFRTSFGVPPGAVRRLPGK